VNGNAWHTVDVTNIVEEIINRVGWTSGNSLSLVFFTDQGTPRREFATIDQNIGLRPQLQIFHSVEPTPDEEEDVQDQAPGPFNQTEDYDWEYNGSYRGIDIFVVNAVGDPEILVVDSRSLAYFNTTKGNPNFNDWAGTTVFNHQNAGCAEFIATLGDWTYLIGQNGSALFVYYSDDEFQTWKSDRVNDDFTGLAGRGSDYGSIWADQTGENLIHLVWSTFSDWNNIVYDIVYSNFTLDPVTENLTWSSTFFNVTEDYATSQRDADMYQEQDGTIHTTWTGINGTVNDIQMYRRRQANGTWLDAVRLSSDDTQDAFEGDVVANETTGVALIAWTQLQVGNWRIKWDVVFPNNTVGTIVGAIDRSVTDARYVSMVNDRSTGIAHMAYQEDSDLQINYRYKAIDNSSSWSAEAPISPAAQQHWYPVEYSNIMEYVSSWKRPYCTKAKIARYSVCLPFKC
jgi:hypothetical protein